MVSSDMTEEQKSRYGEKVCFHVLIMNVFLSVIKLVTGFMGNSFALIADAVHSLTDGITTVGVIISLRISRKPPDKEHPYGHGKIESVAAKIISIFLVAVGIGMLITAFKKVMSGDILVPKGIAIWVALLSIIAKELSYRYTLIAANKLQSTVLAADAWHHRTDALSSVAALIGIIGARFGNVILDPLMAGLVAIFIIWAGYKLLRESIDELIDTLPDEKIPINISNLCEKVEGIKEVRNIKIRKYGMFYIVDLVIVVDPSITVQEGHNVAIVTRKKIINEIEGIKDVFIHVSPFEKSL
jgi:cation diffusion facilitator family transporter